MKTITQEELEGLKGVWDDHRNGYTSEFGFVEAVLNVFPALIAAAEEGLTLRKQLEAEAVYQSGLRDERDALRARVQELEGENAAIRDLLNRIATYPDPEHDIVGHFRRLRRMADSIDLPEASRTPQPPRYTLEEVTYAYTVGYQNGHELTVEASFLPIASSEYTTFWKDDVEELMNEFRGDPPPEKPNAPVDWGAVPFDESNSVDINALPLGGTGPGTGRPAVYTHDKETNP